MTNRQLICAPFVSGVHGLGSAEIIGNLLLSQIVVLPQIPYSFHIKQWIHNNILFANFLFTEQGNIVQIFTIDFSKYLY